MNNPQSITVSLEWAKKLKDAGWPQDGGLYHWYYRDNCDQWELVDEWTRSRWAEGVLVSESLAAPTCEEILRRLPHFVKTNDARGSFDLCTRKIGDTWLVNYQKWELDGFDHHKFLHETEPDTLVHASAAMYCYLAEHNLLPKA